MRNSLKCAFHGIVAAVAGERSLKIMLVFLGFVIAAGVIFSVTLTEWAILLLCCGVVISLELVNTAIESATDLANSQTHPLAKHAKDVAAGAVLLFSLMSVAVGCIIFIPYIIKLIGG